MQLDVGAGAWLAPRHVASDVLDMRNPEQGIGDLIGSGTMSAEAGGNFAVCSKSIGALSE